jgi:hypothetical protein
MRYRDDKRLHETERASQETSKRGLRVSMMFLMLAFMCGVVVAFVYFESLRVAAPAIGGGLPGLFPDLPAIQHPILGLAALGLAGIFLSWLGLEFVFRTLRRP